MSDDYDALLVEDGTPRKKLRATLRKYEGTPLLDIRYWYEDKSSKVYRPTSKGISLTKSNYLSVRSVSIDHHDDIMEYLDVGSTKTTGSADQEAIHNSNTGKFGAVNDVQVKLDFVKPSTAVYSVVYKGATAHIVLNKRHPFIRSITEDISSDESGPGLKIIAELIVAADLTLKTQMTSQTSSPDVISELFGFGLSRHLKKIAEAI